MDAWLLSEGTHLRPYETLGAHADTMDGVTGTRFSVWAPNARRVSVVGQFNYWDGRRHPMRLRKESGIWELFIPGAHNGQLYKYEMIDANGNLRLKSDPYAFEAQMRPETASLICGLPEKVVQTEERKKRISLMRQSLFMKFTVPASPHRQQFLVELPRAGRSTGALC